MFVGPYFLILIRFSLSKSVSLTEKKYQELISNEGSKPLIIFLSHPKCLSCKKTEPIWKEVEEKNSKKSVIFADIDCSENPKLCLSIHKDVLFPQIVWVDQTSHQTVVCNDEFTEENLNKFVQKQLSYPLEFLESKDQLEELCSQVKDSSVFVVHYNDLGDENMKIIEKIKTSAKKVRETHCTFYAIKEVGKKFKFGVYREPKSEKFYKGDLLSQENLDRFVSKSIFPTMVQISGDFIYKLKETKILCLISFLDPKIYLTDWENLALLVETDYQFAYIEYSPDDIFAAFIGVKNSNLPQVVLYNASAQQWLFYDGYLTDTALTKWLNNIDIQNAKWKGPGNGIWSDFRLTWVSVWTRGRMKVLIILGVILCVVGNKVYNEVFKKRPRHKRGSDRGFSTL